MLIWEAVERTRFGDKVEVIDLYPEHRGKENAIVIVRIREFPKFAVAIYAEHWTLSSGRGRVSFTFKVDEEGQLKRYQFVSVCICGTLCSPERESNGLIKDKEFGKRVVALCKECDISHLLIRMRADDAWDERFGGEHLLRGLKLLDAGERKSFDSRRPTRFKRKIVDAFWTILGYRI